MTANENPQEYREGATGALGLLARLGIDKQILRQYADRQRQLLVMVRAEKYDDATALLNELRSCFVELVTTATATPPPARRRCGVIVDDAT